MTIGNLVPWRWGSLRNVDDNRSLEPFRAEMDSLRRSIDRLFTDARGGFFTPPLLSGTWGADKVVPNLDVAEDDKAFQVSVELPGMSDKDVTVTVDDRTLTIRGEKKDEHAYGSFRRTIELPRDVDAAKIEAKFKDGVLTIELPKTKEARERVTQIPVKAA